MDGPSIAIVRSSREWARSLHRYVADYGGAVVRVRPLEERQAIDEEYDILLIDDVTSFLSHRLIQEVHRRGRKVIGVFDTTDIIGGLAVGRERLEQMGTDATIDANSSPEEFLRLVQGTTPVAWSANEELDDLVNSFREENGMDPEVRSAETAAVPSEEPRHGGQVTVVLGASGGVGSTEIAIELARLVRARGEVGIIVDANDVTPSVAQRVGLPLHPNLRTAIDAVEHHVGRLADSILGSPGNQATVLCGLPHPKDWGSLRPEEVLAVVDELAKVCQHVVVDVASQIDDLAGIGGIDRFGVARSVIAEADSIVLVGTASPVGVARLLDRVAELQTIVETTPIHIVINRAPANNFMRGELVEEISRTFVAKSFHFLPVDKKVEDACWAGEMVGNGPFTQAVGEVSLAVLGMNTATRARGKGKQRKAS